MQQQRLQKPASQDLLASPASFKDKQIGRSASFGNCCILLLLIGILTSCGSQTSAILPPKVISATAASTLKPAYNYSEFQTASGLFMKLDGFICTEGPFLSNLITTTNQTSYDVGSAQSIQNYIQLIEVNAAENPKTGLVEWIPPRPPKELQWAAGSTECNGDLAITNTRSSAVEIQRFGLQLTASPVRNSTNYRRISLQEECVLCGGTPGCAYTVSIALNGGTTGQHFDSPIKSTDSVQCPIPIIIPASGSTEFLVTFHDVKMRNMIYFGTPELLLAHEKPIVMPALTSRLSFTHTDALPCYQFQAETFVPCMHS